MKYDNLLGLGLAAFLMLSASVVGSPYLTFDNGPGPVQIQALDFSGPQMADISSDQPFLAHRGNAPTLISSRSAGATLDTLTADR